MINIVFGAGFSLGLENLSVLLDFKSVKVLVVFDVNTGKVLIDLHQLSGSVSILDFKSLFVFYWAFS